MTMCNSDYLSMFLLGQALLRSERAHIVTTFYEVRTQHVNVILHPSDVRMEKVTYHPAVDEQY